MIFGYAGKTGFGLIMMVRQDRLQKGVPSNYLKKYGTYTKVLSNLSRYL